MGAIYYRQKIWQGIKFDNLQVYLGNDQNQLESTNSSYLYRYICMVMLYRTAKFNIKFWAHTATNFNSHQYFQLYSTALSYMYLWLGCSSKENLMHCFIRANTAETTRLNKGMVGGAERGWDKIYEAVLMRR